MEKKEKKIVVCKFGGSSIKKVEDFDSLALLVKGLLSEDISPIIVISAMYQETNRLTSLAKAIDDRYNGRELEVVISSGEQASIGLLAIALKKNGITSKSYLGYQLPIITSDDYANAIVKSIYTGNLLSDVDEGVIPIVAGFQGMTTDGDITTLGREGSDTTAMAIACSIGALECRIYKDVDGFYSFDPKIEPSAMLIKNLSYEEALLFSTGGSKVLHRRAVNIANDDIKIKIFNQSKNGSLVAKTNETFLEKPKIKGISVAKNEVILTIHTDDIQLVVGEFFGFINVLHLENEKMTLIVEENHKIELLEKIEKIEKIARITLVGSGLLSYKEAGEIYAKIRLLGVSRVVSMDNNICLIVGRDEADRIAKELHKLV